MELELKKRLTMYPHQEPIVSDIIRKFGSKQPYVLGSSPSSGKTEMAIETIIELDELMDKYLEENEILRSRYIEKLIREDMEKNGKDIKPNF